MKSIHWLIVSLLLVWLTACQRSSPQPDTLNLSGKWLMTDRRYWKENSWLSKPVPASPSQTITFMYPHQLSTEVTDDTTLALHMYFEFGGGGSGIIGPYVLLKKKADSREGHMFSYVLSAKADTLRLSEFGREGRYQYSFRRY